MIKNKNLKVYIYCLIVAFLFLLIATKSSPLYVCNDWVDSNIFFNIAKGIVHGEVPYRDLFEQKGPLLYFAYIIPYLISNDTFLGVYFLEVLLFSLTLFAFYKTINLFCNVKASCLVIPIFSFFALNTRSFLHGGSAEELCMPCTMASLYYLMKYFKTSYPESISRKDLFINGIFAGIVLWTKYTFLGFYFGFCIVIGLSLLKRKRIKELFISGGYFLLGMLIPSAISIIYFVFNNAVYDLFYTYFYVNMTAYGSSGNIIAKIVEPLQRFWKFSMENRYPFFIICFGYLYMIYEFIIKEKRVFEYIMITGILFISIIFVYLGIGWTYYYFFFMPFMVFAFIFVGKIIEKLSGNNIMFAGELVLGTVLLFCITYKVNNNVYMLEYTKDNVMDFKFAEIINNYENPTLLAYDTIYANLFTNANILPNKKYFFAANIDKDIYTELAEEQKRYIKEREVDFILIKYYEQRGEFSDVPYLEENYEYAAECYYSTDGGLEYLQYYLFKLKGLEPKKDV